MFLEIYDRIRADPVFANSTIGFIFESNMGQEQATLTRLVTSTGRMDNYFLFFEVETVNGIRTSHEVRVSSDDMMLSHTRAESIFFYKDMIVAEKGKTRADNRALLLGQMAQLQEFVRTDVKGNETRIITAIHGPDNNRRIKGRKDDAYRALAMLVYCAQRADRREPKIMDWDRIARLHLKRAAPASRFEAAASNKRIRLAADKMYKSAGEGNGEFFGFLGTLRNQNVS